MEKKNDSQKNLGTAALLLGGALLGSVALAQPATTDASQVVASLEAAMGTAALSPESEASYT